jgi:hypothetical protein
LHCGADEVLGRAANASEKVVAKVRRALEMSKAKALVLPLGLSGHVDYVTARDVALSAQGAAGFPVAFYEELPYAAGEGAEAAIDAAVVQLTLTVQSKLQPVFATEARQGDALEEAVARRRRIAWCYDSQMDESATTEIAEFCKRYEGRERIWGNAAWSAEGLAEGTLLG